MSNIWLSNRVQLWNWLWIFRFWNDCSALEIIKLEFVLLEHPSTRSISSTDYQNVLEHVLRNIWSGDLIVSTIKKKLVFDIVIYNYCVVLNLHLMCISQRRLLIKKSQSTVWHIIELNYKWPFGSPFLCSSLAPSNLILMSQSNFIIGCELFYLRGKWNIMLHISKSFDWSIFSIWWSGRSFLFKSGKISESWTDNFMFWFGWFGVNNIFNRMNWFNWIINFFNVRNIINI